MFRRFFRREVHDPVTGRSFPKEIWQSEVESRALVASVRKDGGRGMPNVTALGVPDPDHSGIRSEIAFWLVEQWAYEDFGLDPDDLPATGFGWAYADLFEERMTDGELFLLLRSIPDEAMAPELPEQRGTAAAMKAVPRDEDSYERHRWRFEIRRQGLAERREQMMARYAPGDGSPIEAWVLRFFAELDQEIDAEYCGFETCTHCSNPLPENSSEGPKDGAAEDAALQRLSAEARLVVGKSKTTRRLWSDLVDRVGADEAVEQVEAAVLMSQIDATADVVSEAMQSWKAGFSSAEAALEGIAGLTEEAQPKVDVAVEAVRAKSQHQEARELAEAGAAYFSNLRTTAEGFLTGMFELSPAVAGMGLATTEQLKVNWDNARERWDKVSGRPLLPLVGDR
jgi:hypothetical protein